MAAKKSGARKTAETVAKKNAAKKGGARKTVKKSGARETAETAAKKNAAKKSGARKTAKKSGARKTAETAAKKNAAKKSGARKTVKKSGARETAETAAKKNAAKKSGARKTAKKSGARKAAKTAARKNAAKKTAAKKSGARKTAKKAGARKTAKKSGARKTAKKAGVRKTAQKNATKKSAATKSAATKSAAKKSAAKKSAAKKNAAEKSAAKKSAAKKAGARKMAKRTAAKKTAAEERAPGEGLSARLLAALDVGDAAGVARLLAAGADVDTRDEDDIPALFIATMDVDLPVVTALLDGGADVDTVDEALQQTPLMLAVAERELELIALLLARGADVDHFNAEVDGANSPLLVSLEWHPLSLPRPAVIAAVLAAGADVERRDSTGWTPLMRAAQHEDAAVVDLLLKAGADASVTGPRGLLPVDVAARQGHDEVVALLVAAGSPTPDESAASRVAALWRGIDGWCRGNAVPCHPSLQEAGPAEAARIEALEQALAAALPADFRAHLLRLGGRPRVPFYAYECLDVEAILSRWQELERSRKGGRFAAAEPLELDRDAEEVQCQWWHRGWVPFAQDGGGNLYCVDLDPGPSGRRGQVIQWETHRGPVRPLARSFVDFLAEYLDRLESGDCRWDGTAFVRG
ncbi:ankyrin repeat domain-containing protein [Nannocystis punicea]|uniref:SMI1/KNR4 family protein n=1 Tax=Nannocystis punicea TaxID=2995304 RepID=A0ABY7HIM3_9BACT|nr:ankyrin repeat domain-containing protein [Nannocystis poenicansa]WAS99180.1 SMI1/KNR4 family protein [Nannocystis poenicansa]